MADGSCCGQAVHDRHHDIHQNGVKSLGLMVLEDLQGLLPIVRHGGFGSGILQKSLRNFRIQLIVLHQQYMKTGYIGIDRCFRIAYLCLDQRHWDFNRKCRPYILLAIHRNGAAE